MFHLKLAGDRLCFQLKGSIFLSCGPFSPLTQVYHTLLQIPYCKHSRINSLCVYVKSLPIFFPFQIVLFVFGCAGSSLLRGLSLVVVHGLLIGVASLVVEQGLQGAWASAVAARGLRSCSSRTLEHSCNSCGARASLPCSV